MASPQEVVVRSVDSLLHELGIDRVDLLKIDVEGAEDEVLRSFEGLAHVSAVVGEIHPNLVDDASALVRLLEESFELSVERSLPERWRFRRVRAAAG
jgi:hypothetical protein